MIVPTSTFDVDTLIDLAEIFSVSRPIGYRTLNRHYAPLTYDPAHYRNRPAVGTGQTVFYRS